jgi:hypothetical protein
MTTTYPITKQTIPNPSSTDTLENVTPELDHDYQHSTVNDTIEALQDKVGVDGSAVTTTHDYKLSEVTSTDKAVGKTATQTLTNKTLTSPTVTGMTATTSTVNGVTLSSTGSSSLYLKEDGTYGSVTAGDASFASKGSVQGLTDTDTSGLVISSGVISVNSGTTANKIVKLDASAKLPAVDGSQLTNVVIYKTGTATRAGNTASGTQTIAHGLGRTPKFVKITAFLTSSVTTTSTAASFGAYDGTTNACLLTNNPLTGSATIATANGQAEAYIAYLAYSNSFGTGYQRATAAVSSTNITLTWTYSDNGGNTGLGTNNILMLWEAQG